MTAQCIVENSNAEVVLQRALGGDRSGLMIARSVLLDGGKTVIAIYSPAPHICGL